MKLNTNRILWIVVIAFAILLALSLKTCAAYKADNKENENLIESLNDTVKVWKDKEGRSNGSIGVITTRDPNDFLDIQFKDRQIIKLQELVKQYKNKLGSSGSATNFSSETKYDTIYETKIEIREALGNATYIDSISNNWINTRFGFSGGKTIYSLKVKEDYSIVIGEESQGWFKPKKPFAQVTSYNPYSEIQTLRTYKVTVPKKGLSVKPGIYGGYGGTIIDGEIKTGFQVGGGININF